MWLDLQKGTFSQIWSQMQLIVLVFPPRSWLQIGSILPICIFNEVYNLKSFLVMKLY